MKPLGQETNFTSHSEQLLAELVRSASGHQVSPFRKRLVRTRIQAAVRAGGGSRSLRYAGVVALLVCSSAAAATLGYRFVSIGDAPASSQAPSRAVSAPIAETPRPSPVPAQPAAEAPKTVEQAAPVERTQPVKSRPTAEREKPKADGEDPSQMLEAVRALRKEGNPEQAQKLLDGYLATHPAGALSEDALALSIEAATARRDPRAGEYARRYLAQYPKGRFRQLALRAIAAER